MRLLLERGEEVRAFIKPETPEATLAGLDIERVHGDVRDLAALQAAAAGRDEVYHLATYNRLWARDPAVFSSVNAEGTENVLRAATAASVRRVVHTSTCDIVGIGQRSRGEEGTEEDFPATADGLPGPYARSKWKAEMSALDYAAKGIECVIVNPTIPVGPYDVLPTEPGRLICDFLAGKVRFFIARRLNFLDVRDCAAGHLLAMKKGRSGQRYILGGANMDLEEFFARLEEVSGVPRSRMRAPYFVAYGAACLMDSWGRITGREPRASLEGIRLIRHSFAFSSRKAKEELGYQPSDITVALRDAVEWFRGRRAGENA